MLTKTKIVKHFGVIALLGSLSCSIAPILTSCSTVVPTFTVTNATQDWIKGATVDVAAIWKGYYFDDVNNPADATDLQIDWNGHENDVTLIQDPTVTHKWKDDAKKIESCNIRFQVNTDSDPNTQPFDVYITWTIKHSDFKKVSTLTIKPPKDSIINIDKQFLYSAVPDTSSDVENTKLLNDNSFQSIDSVYNEKTLPSTPTTIPSRQDIETHLTNDFKWYQYLIFNSLAYVWIDDSIGIWATLNDSSWKFSVDLEYNFNTQIFDYVNIHIEADGNVFLGGFNAGTANLTFDYAWGTKAESDKNIDPVPGPKLMGAYTAGKDALPHFPQNFIGKNKEPGPFQPYTQNFLALASSTTQTCQTYDMTIKSNATLYKTTIDIGQHAYFLSQPRFLGLEYASGQNHIQVRPDHHDSFKNWQLAIPSYTLSGMSYDFTTNSFTQPYGQIDIQQCYVDINKNPQQTFNNSWTPGDKADWASKFMLPINGSDVNINNQDPDFIQDKLKEFDEQNACIDQPNVDKPSWWNVTIYAPDKKQILQQNVPYYQIIQEASDQINDKYGQPPTSLALYDTNANIQVSNDSFTRFAVGLNYMFYADNMKKDADNVFYYSDDSLKELNNLFH